jgi:mRNA-degrading endonuclease RelE of RelBE toxin-antitoxin system
LNGEKTALYLPLQKPETPKAERPYLTPMPGNKSYSIEYLDVVKSKDIPDLPTKVKTMIKTAIEERLMIDPIGFGKPLRYSLKGHRRLRVSDYRVVYRIDPAHHRVVVVAIKHRKDVYGD